MSSRAKVQHTLTIVLIAVGLTGLILFFEEYRTDKRFTDHLKEPHPGAIEIFDSYTAEAANFEADHGATRVDYMITTRAKIEALYHRLTTLENRDRLIEPPPTTPSPAPSQPPAPGAANPAPFPHSIPARLLHPH